MYIYVIFKQYVLVVLLNSWKHMDINKQITSVSFLVGMIWPIVGKQVKIAAILNLKMADMTKKILYDAIWLPVDWNLDIDTKIMSVAGLQIKIWPIV